MYTDCWLASCGNAAASTILKPALAFLEFSLNLSYPNASIAFLNPNISDSIHASLETLVQSGFSAQGRYVTFSTTD